MSRRRCSWFFRAPEPIRKPTLSPGSTHSFALTLLGSHDTLPSSEPSSIFPGHVTSLEVASPPSSSRSAQASVEVAVRPSQDVLVLDLSGKILGGNESDVLRAEMDRILQGDVRRVLVNLSGVPWMNSAGLGILLSGYSRLRDRGGMMGFFGIQERVREILETTKLVTVLGIFADEEAGLHRLRSGGNPDAVAPKAN